VEHRLARDDEHDRAGAHCGDGGRCRLPAAERAFGHVLADCQCRRLHGGEVMKTRCRMLDAGCWMRQTATVRASRILYLASSLHSRAFTLIEIMIVVAIMGIILATGSPSIYRIWKKEGMRQAVSDVVEVCSNARARAIFSGTQV